MYVDAQPGSSGSASVYVCHVSRIRTSGYLRRTGKSIFPNGPRGLL
jgi:hypothetical protein